MGQGVAGCDKSGRHRHTRGQEKYSTSKYMGCSRYRAGYAPVSNDIEENNPIEFGGLTLQRGVIMQNPPRSTRRIHFRARSSARPHVAPGSALARINIHLPAAGDGFSGIITIASNHADAVAVLPGNQEHDEDRHCQMPISGKVMHTVTQLLAAYP